MAEITKTFKTPEEIKKPLEERTIEDVRALKSELDELKKELEESRKENSEIQQKLVELSEEKLQDSIDASLKWWLSPYEPKIVDDGVGIVDPIYGYVIIEKELVPLLMHPLIQRLNFVKQLSFSYLEFPTAQHTRLAHSIGVCKNAELALDAIFRHGKTYSTSGEGSISIDQKESERIRLEAKAASLLHDVGHGPFGHCIDRYIGLKENIHSLGHFDKRYSVEYIEKYLRNLLGKIGLDADNIKNILSEDKTELSGFSELVSQIIDSPLDVDRMDYMVRDAHLSGLPLGFINVKQIVESIMPFSSAEHLMISYSMDALYHIEHFLYARDSMYVNCYESPKKTAAEGMAVSALKDFDETFKIPLEKIILLGDHQLLATIINFAPPKTPCYELARKLIRGDIFSEIYERALLPVKGEIADRNAEIQSFIESMGSPEKKTTTWVQRPSEWCEIIAKGSGLNDNPWKVLVTVPPMDIYHSKEVGVDLLRRKDSGYSTIKLEDQSHLVEDLLRVQSKARLKIRVFADSELPLGKREEVRSAAKKIFETK